MDVKIDMNPKSILSLKPHALLLLAAVLLAGCGPHRALLPVPNPDEFQDFAIEEHRLDWTGLTVGPYEVRNIKVRYDHADSTRKSGRKKKSRVHHRQRYGFTVAATGLAPLQAECREHEIRERNDSLMGWGISFHKGELDMGNRYVEGFWKNDVEFGCRFKSPSDTAWSDRMGLLSNRIGLELLDGVKDSYGSGWGSIPIERREASLRKRGLWQTTTCYMLGYSKVTWGALDTVFSRIYLEESMAGNRKVYAVAAMVAIHLRKAKPGLVAWKEIE